MPRIPQYESRVGLTTEASGTRFSQDAAAMTGQSMQNLGSSVMNAAMALDDYGDRIRQVRNQEEISRAAIEAEKTFVSLYDEAGTDPDYLNYHDRYNKRIQSKKYELGKKITDKDAKRSFERAYDESALQAGIKIKNIMDKRLIEAKRASLDEQIEMSKERFFNAGTAEEQDTVVSTIEKLIDHNQSLGVISAETAVTKKQGLKKAFIEEMVYRDIEADPETAIERLDANDYGLTSTKEISEYREKAKKAIKSRDAVTDMAEYSTLLKDLYDSRVDYDTFRENVLKRNEAGKLTKEDAEELLEQKMSKIGSYRDDIIKLGIDGIEASNDIDEDQKKYMIYRAKERIDSENADTERIPEIFRELKHDHILDQNPELKGLPLVPNYIFSTEGNMSSLMETKEPAQPDYVYNRENGFIANKEEKPFYTVYLEDKGVSVGFDENLTGEEMEELIGTRFYPNKPSVISSVFTKLKAAFDKDNMTASVSGMTIDRDNDDPADDEPIGQTTERRFNEPMPLTTERRYQRVYDYMYAPKTSIGQHIVDGLDYTQSLAERGGLGFLRFSMETLPLAAVGGIKAMAENPEYMPIIGGTPLMPRQNHEGILRFAKRLEKNILSMREEILPDAEIKEDDSWVEEMAFKMGSGAGSLALFMGSAVASGGSTVLPAILAGGIQFGNKYNESRAKDKSEAESMGISSVSAAIEGGLESVGLGFMLKKYGGLFSNLAFRSFSEGAQEALQTGGEWGVDALSGLRKDTSITSLIAEMGESALIGVTLGLPSSLMVTYAERNGWIDELQEIGFPKRAAKKIVEKMIVDSRNAAEDIVATEIETQEDGMTNAPDWMSNAFSGEETESDTMENIDQFPVVQIPVSDLKLDPNSFQFKGGVDEHGVVENERLQGKYDHLGAGNLLVWQNNKGEMYVVNGHHRYDLAKRSGTSRINAQVIKESDGFTADKAKYIGAEINIKDGTGKVEDYADFFRFSGITQQEAESRGLLARSKGKHGFSLGRFAEDDLFALYKNGRIKEKQAVAVAEGAPNDKAVQNIAINHLLKNPKISGEELLTFTKAVNHLGLDGAGGAGYKQGEMFDSGMDDAIQEMGEMSRIASGIVSELKEDLLSIKSPLKRSERAKKYGMKFENIEDAAIQKEYLERQIKEWDSWYTDQNKVNYIRTQLKDGVQSNFIEGWNNFKDLNRIEDSTASEETAEEDDRQGSFFESEALKQKSDSDALFAKWWGVTLDPEKTTDKQINKTDVLKRIEQLFDVPVRGMGTVRSKAVGLHYTFQKLIRQKKWGELEVLSHEIAHRIDRINTQGMGKKWKSEIIPEHDRNTALDELVQLDYDFPFSQRETEGFAEFMRHYLTTGKAQGLAPTYYQHFEEYLRQNPEMRSKIDEMKGMFDTWYAQGAENRVINQIDWNGEHTKTKGLRRKAEKVYDWFQKSFNDEFYFLKKVTDKIEKASGKTLKPSQNPYKLATYSKQKASSIARTFVMDKAVDEYGRPVGKGLLEILKPINPKQFRQFISYAVSRRALDLANRNIESGIDIADARYIVDKYDNLVWDQVIDEITQWSNHLLDWVIRAGGLGQKEAQVIRQLNPIYVPFKRAFMEGELFGKRGSGSFVNQAQAVKRMEGSGRPIINPLESLIGQATEMIQKAQKIKVARALAELGDSIDDIGGFITKVPAPQTATVVSVQSIEKLLEEKGLEITNMDGEKYVDELGFDNLLTIFQNDWAYRGKDNIVSIWKQGERQFYEVHPELYRALTGIDMTKRPPVLNMLGMATRMLKLGATTLNPGFWFSNVIKDIPTGVIQSKRLSANPMEALEAIAKNFAGKESELVSRAQAMGLTASGFIGNDRASTMRVADELMMENLGKIGKVLKVAKHPIDSLREVVSFTEMSSRSPELEKNFQRYLKDNPNWTEEDAFIEAFNDAQDVTINFTKSGTVSKQMNEVYAFFNSALRGPEKLIRSLSERPVETLVKGMAWITLPALMQWRWNKDKEWYKNLPLEYKYSNMFFEIGDTVYRIPLPFEIGVIFGGIPMAIMDGFVDDEIEADEAMTAIKDAMIRQLPFSSLMDMIPDIARPVVEVWRNEDHFGRPIESIAMQYQHVTERKYENTSDLAAGLSKAFNAMGVKLSPVQADYLMKSYTGGLTAQLVNEFPIFNRFVLNNPEKPRRQMDKFFNEYEELGQKVNSDIASKDEQKRFNKIKPIYTFMRTQFKELREAGEDEVKVTKIFVKMRKKLNKYGY